MILVRQISNTFCNTNCNINLDLVGLFFYHINMDNELYVVDLADFLEAVIELKGEIRANDEYSYEFKRGSDFVCEFLIDNYGEVLHHLVSKNLDKLN